jgi:hypothetical protein
MCLQGACFNGIRGVSAQISAIPTLFFNAKSIIHVGEPRKTTF